jgi:Ca2+-transporting ATPase
MTVTKVFTTENQEIFDYEYTNPHKMTEALRQTLRIGRIYI